VVVLMKRSILPDLDGW